MVTTSGPTRRPGRPPKVEAGDTKAALLAAALKLFARNGYAGTSIRAIAREVGLSESGLYAHFDSKRAIFDAALARLGPQGGVTLFEGLDPALAQTDAPQFLRYLVAQLMDAWSAPPACQFISMAARDGLIHDPALRAQILQETTRLAELFSSWIDTGRIAADLGAPQDLAYALLGPIAQARLLWLHSAATPEDLATAREKAALHTEFFIRAVFRPQGRTPQCRNEALPRKPH
jgi:AcrR family transcriptional regulator